MKCECEGSCTEHIGEVRLVDVHGNLKDSPWRFSYCDKAVEEDRCRGFVVVDVEPRADGGGE